MVWWKYSNNARSKLELARKNIEISFVEFFWYYCFGFCIRQWAFRIEHWAISPQAINSKMNQLQWNRIRDRKMSSSKIGTLIWLHQQCLIYCNKITLKLTRLIHRLLKRVNLVLSERQKKQTGKKQQNTKNGKLLLRLNRMENKNGKRDIHEWCMWRCWLSAKE